MEKDTEKPESTGIKQERNPDGTFPPGVSGNPNGRPKGSEDFKTKWLRAIEKIAKQNELTPDDIEQQILLVGYKKAKEGDYSFYKDILDRIYGKPVQTNINEDSVVSKITYEWSNQKDNNTLPTENMGN